MSNLYMHLFKKIKVGLNNPELTIRYVLQGGSIFNKKKFMPLYNIVKENNRKKSKYPDYFDICKRILSDSVNDPVIRKHFFENQNQLTETEIKKTLQSSVHTNIIAGMGEGKNAHTMIGLIRLENLQFCVEDVIKNNVEGDMIEAGVWRGGSCIFMRLILKKYEINDKIVFVADSFEGLPKPDPKYQEDDNDTFHTWDILKVSLEKVKQNFELYGVLDKQVMFLKGWFKDTLKNTPIQKLSILRLDGDMYGSTMDILENLYDKVSSGGYVIVDDYILLPCRKAIDDFRKDNDIHEPIIEIDGIGVYWKKL
jgi:O-methyltransferase